MKKTIKIPIIMTSLFLIFGTTSFALTAPNTIEAEDIENIIDYIYSIQDEIYSTVSVENRKATLDSIKQNVIYSNVANNWNTYINMTTMPYMENITITFKVDANYLYIYMTPSNNTIGDIAPFPKVKEIYGDNYNNILLSYTNSNGESVSVRGNYIRIDKNGVISYSADYKPGQTSTYLYDNIAVDSTNSTCYIPSILGLNTNTTIYFKQGDNSVFSWYINENKINTVNRVIPEIPEEPEPEQPTTSGEYGSVLDDINNKLDNIPTKEDIKQSQINASTSYWGNSGEIKQEDFENTISGEITGIMETMSGELIKNKIFAELESAESGFLDFFKEEQEERFYDLAFSWEDVEIFGATLIPKGGINISEMCREIPKLGEIQALIRTITNFSVCILLVKQIYNLILSTLGIDNPYLYEEDSMSTETIIDMDNDTMIKQYTGTAKDGSKYRIKSNHTREKPRNKIGF